MLDYDGDVRRESEFLISLAKFLKSSKIEDKWKANSENRCYIIKFFASIAKFTDYTFNVEDMDYLDETEIHSEKIKWIIHKSLRHVHDDIFYGYADECYSYLKFDETIPYSDMLNIYTDVDYLEEYKVKGD